MLSVIIPAYNEEKNIPRTAETIAAILEKENIPFELLFVNDGSRDRTWEEISACAEKDPRVRGLCFSRNFGKEAAMFAGLENAVGDCCALIDCDLQHPPEKLPEMYRLWEDGYEIVEGVKADRGTESAAHAFAARCFYSIISRAVGFDMSRASDYKLLDRKAVAVLVNLREKNAFLRALSSWVGFRTTEVEYTVQSREYGSSKWSTMALVKYALSNIAAFSAAPMQLVTLLGIITLVFSAVLGVETLVEWAKGNSLGGFPTVIIMLGFIGSILMISLGIIGYYIAKIYEEIKGRPRFIISREAGSKQKKP